MASPSMTSSGTRRWPLSASTSGRRERRWGERGRLSDHGIVRSGPYTVRAAVEDYLAEIDVEKRAAALKAARYILAASVLPG